MNKANSETFAQLWDALGCKGSPDRAFACIADRYGDPRRKYHTLTHVGWALHRIDEMAADDKTRGAKHIEHEWNLIRWAVWFHDLELDGSPSDEPMSAQSAWFWASDGGLAREDCDAVRRLVLATGHDRVPLRYDEATICDADLSILGADDDAFWHYERLVREEWAHVPDLLFATARASILKRFIDRPWIYMTEYGRTRWERKARANLAASIAILTAGSPKGRNVETKTPAG